MLKKTLGISLCLVVILAVSSAATAQAAAVSKIPDTAPGRLLKDWLESFNAGDLERRTKFLGEHAGNAGMSPSDAAQRDMRFRERIGGGFDFYKVEDSSDTAVRAILKERGGVGWAEIELKVDAAKPDTIISTVLHPAPPPAEARPVREDQATLIKDLGQFVDKLAAEDRFSGVVLMAKDGQPVFEKACGYSDREKKTPNQMDTQFNLGSMNKMFTSVAVAQLVQQGKMSYTDTVAKLLPDYPNRQAAEKITVHQLLTHTSGLGDFFGPEFDRKKDSIRVLKDYVQFFAAQPPQFEPGASWAYSNAGMIVAGLIVERVSGQNYFDYVREHIYKPAGMNDSGTYEKTKPPAKQAIGYARENGTWKSNYDTLPLMGSSAGGGYATAPDLLRFDQALRGHKLLNAELTTTVTTGKVKTPLGDKYAYGFSESMVDEKRVVGHNGGGRGISANMDMYWDSGYTVVVLANIDPRIADEVSRYIRDRIQQ